MHFAPYLDQLDALCAETGVDLAKACAAEGVAPSTLSRWRQRKVAPREATAKALFSRIDAMARRATRRAKRQAPQQRSGDMGAAG